MKHYRPVVLVILDGWGETKEVLGNPFCQAVLPTIKKLNRHYPKTLCQASGLSVGLPWGVCGNSEVGHQTLGTGQVIYQNLPLISLAIKKGDFFRNQILLEAFQRAKERHKKVHFLGLLSDGGVHSHIDHLLALLEMSKKIGINPVIHLFSDGRDAPQKSFEKYWLILKEKMTELKIGKIGSVMGRFYGMDRNKNWERTELAYRALVFGQGISVQEEDLLSEIKKRYEQEQTDEFIQPIVISDEKGQSLGRIAEGDEIIFFNFRRDRGRQISQALLNSQKVPFLKNTQGPKITLTAFIDYDDQLELKTVFAFPEPTAFLGEELAKAGKKQLRIAETEKYAHVTYFFNGGKEKPFTGEERILVESKKVATYDLAPEMGAKEITDKLLNELEKNYFDFILVNFANPDMVGHTGNLAAAVKALEAVDFQLGRLVDKVLEKGGSLLISADHGNVEEMVNLKNGEVDTEHSLNPVPCWLVAKDFFREERQEKDLENVYGMLVDIPPTILELLGMPKNSKMDGTSLLEIMLRD